MKRLAWFVRPRTIWCPTLVGWVLILGLLAMPAITWCIWGESFLCLTNREPAEVLVVEGWVGDEVLQAAAAEFKSGNYHWAVTTGGPNGENWQRQRWTYAQIGFDRLAAYGVPRDKIIMSPAPEVESQRTHTSAVSAKQALAAAGIEPTALNIFTRGAHARRSRLVYARVFEPAIKVGIVSWLPNSTHANPWWKSTVRSKDVLTETIGYLYEALLGSGRSKDIAPIPSISATLPTP